MAAANPISSSCQSIVSVAANTVSLGSLQRSHHNNNNNNNSTTNNNNNNNNNSSHYINGTGSLGRLKYHHKHKSLDASDDEELDYSQLSQSSHLLGRVKSDRFLASSRQNEDRRRRTIIVEKQNDSYGFTLQSYGIHYKRDEEVEMVTYVDYVEHGGPAYRAGMREGDVILSINGRDMQKADHKTIVEGIKSSDTRMRMVVLFEDCVRKVDLHMRYIQLQNLLQSKMNELEHICLRERELLEGKWKTHSLPARKKAITSPSDAVSGVGGSGIAAASGSDGGGLSPTDSDVMQHASYYRPTLSTEDVTNMGRQQQTHHLLHPAAIIPPPAQFMLTYHYLDPSYRYVLKPATSQSSGEYFVSMASGGESTAVAGGGMQRSPSDQRFILSRAASGDVTASATTLHFCTNSTGNSQQQRRQPPMPPPRTCEKHKPPQQQQQQQSPKHQTKDQQQEQSQSQHQKSASTTPKKASKSGKHCHSHSCNPCIGHFRWKSSEKTTAIASGGGGGGTGDNVSLDAYDLASPCCDTHCVPSRRRSRHHKEHTHKHKHRDRDRSDEQHQQTRTKSQSQASPGTGNRHVHHHHHHHHTSGASGSEVQQQQQQQPHHHHHHRHVQAHSQQAGFHHQQQQQQQQQHHHHHQTQQQTQHGKHGACDSHSGSIRSRYFDLATGLASHCSLHSCTSSDFAPADSTSYSTSLSTDTLYWDPKSGDNAAAVSLGSRQHSTKSRQSTATTYQQPLTQQVHGQTQAHIQQHVQQGIYQQRYHITATQIQPAQIYPNATFVHKPKSWDNLTTKEITADGIGFGSGSGVGGVIGRGSYGGYGYLNTMSALKPTVQLQITTQQRHSMPRKNPYGRYSTYADAVENYAPPPSQFVEELTTTTMTRITTKSTEELIAARPIQAQQICDCFGKQQHQQQHALKAAQLQLSQSQKMSHHNSCQMGGYYSHLPRPTTDACTSTTLASGGAQANSGGVDGGTGSGSGNVGTTGARTKTVTGSAGDITTVSEVTRL